jgi:hypothetical protein
MYRIIQQLGGKNSRSIYEGKRMNELFFQIKSFKPHKGQCLEVCDRFFSYAFIKNADPPKIQT